MARRTNASTTTTIDHVCQPSTTNDARWGVAMTASLASPAVGPAPPDGWSGGAPLGTAHPVRLRPLVLCSADRPGHRLPGDADAGAEGAAGTGSSQRIIPPCRDARASSRSSSPPRWWPPPRWTAAPTPGALAVIAPEAPVRRRLTRGAGRASPLAAIGAGRPCRPRSISGGAVSTGCLTDRRGADDAMPDRLAWGGRGERRAVEVARGWTLHERAPAPLS